MILGALFDAGLDEAAWRSEIKKLNLDDYEITVEDTKKKSIAGKLVKVTSGEKHPHRHLHHVLEIINQGDFTPHVKDLAGRIFTRLAHAEAKVHNTTIEKIHFHEVGAIDAIVDIVGSVVGFEMLGIHTFYSSPIPTGTGFVNCAHGRMPVPAPATAEMLKGVALANDPIRGAIAFELTTPTGAAIVCELCESFGPRPGMQIEAGGYGAGEYELEEIPNLLRVFIGTAVGRQTSHSARPDVAGIFETDRVLRLETNIDDMNPELYADIFEALFSKGALDVFATSVIMKKGRPGTLLTVLCHEDKLETIREEIFTQTTTLGIRVDLTERYKLERRFEEVQTPYGPVRVKIAFAGDREFTVSPEYESCKEIARKNQTPLRLVYEAARRAARNS